MSANSKPYPRILGENETSFNFIKGRGHARLTPAGVACSFVVGGEYDPKTCSTPEVNEDLTLNLGDPRLVVDPHLEEDAAIWGQEPLQLNSNPDNSIAVDQIRISQKVLL